MKKTKDFIGRLSEYLTDRLASEKSVIAVYVFGSYAQGKARPDSDLDLAFLVDEEIYKHDGFEASKTPYLVSAYLSQEFDIETDVIILNSASIEVAYEIVTQGKCLYFSDKDKKIEYEIKIRGLYFDFKPFLEELRSKTLKNL